MAYFNFEIPATGKQYSVDFTVYSNQYNIAGAGYRLLPVTETALTGATVFNTAADWLTGNAALFATTTTDTSAGSSTTPSGS